MNRVGSFNQILSLLIKIFVVIGIVAVGIIVYQACSGSPIIQRIDKTLPSIESAPYQVTTKTHLYYAEEATINYDSVTMTVWYEKDGGKWIKHDNSITLPKALWPNVTLRPPE